MTEEQIMKIKARLKKTAQEKFPDNKERQNAYIFGTLNRIKNKQ